jgi:hypothetical protein
MQASNVVNGLAALAPIGLTAAVTNDTTNAGVDWSACGSTGATQVSCASAAACGLFQVIPAVPPTSTSLNGTPAVCAATMHTASGQPALYIPPSQPPSPGGTVTIAAKAHNPAATSSLATATAAVSITSAAPPAGVPLSGFVMAGTTQPVSGATVSLYAAGTSGYSSASSLLDISWGATQVLTGANGQFTIPAGYACPSQSSQMYLVAIGGNAGGGINPNLAMMTALGPCGGLSSAVSITINEVTTIGSIWPLAPFMSDFAHIGSSSANATAGLANAFATVNNLVNVTTGQALAMTPVGNGAVPQSEINTLADILNTCSITAGGAVGDGSNCGALFSVTNLGTLAATAPTNTLQAALNIAKVPQVIPQNGATAYSLLTVNGPFSPILTTAPNDWAISISFTGGGLGGTSSASSQSSAFAIDGSGNVWIANRGINSVTELNNLGAALSPPTTGTTLASAGGYQGGGLSSPSAIAIDQLGNPWIANGTSSLTELSPVGSATSPSTGFSGGGLRSPVKGLAIDGAGNAWAVNTASTGSVSWFAGANATINGVPTAAGTPLSPSGAITQGISKPNGAIGIDTSGTVWVMNTGNSSATEFNSSTGSFIQSDYGYTSTVPRAFGSVLTSQIGNGIAIDNTGDVFLTEVDQLAELLAGGSSTNDGGLGTLSSATGVDYSGFLALDGASHLWLLITGGNITCTSSYSLLEMSSGGSQLNSNAIGCGYLGPALDASAVATAVDGSGNVWVLSSSSVTEFIGVAAPVVTPLSLGVQNKTLGKKP